MIAAATTTWNSSDIIGHALSHFEQLGFDRVYVMDFASEDGTPEILTSARWRQLVHLVPFPGLGNLDSSNIILAIARQHEKLGWMLFCDPDEFLVTPGMAPVGDCLCATPAAAIAIPRFNMTGRRTLSAGTGPELFSFANFNLRIDRTAKRVAVRDIAADLLDPPWIYSAMPGKIFTRIECAGEIGPGDHTVTLLPGTETAPLEGFHLLHFPIRTYGEFESRTAMAARDFAANPGLSQNYGWHARRWLRLRDQGMLRTEYLQQLVPDGEVERLTADGILVIDNAIRNLHN